MTRAGKPRPKCDKPRIAVFSGPTATIQNSPPLLADTGAGASSQVLRPQRLAAPVEVLVEQFSAHPLERDAAEDYGPPDFFRDPAGNLKRERTSEADVPVYKVSLDPADGLYLLPYRARAATGQLWSARGGRQTFYPDASRIYEEIDRFCLDYGGANNILSRLAIFTFFRAMPSGGYTKGLPGQARTDAGEGSIAPEQSGVDFFSYEDAAPRLDPDLAALARATNCVSEVLAEDDFDGVQWLESSPTVAETAYWLNLLIDTDRPIVAHASQRPHQMISADGPKNIVDGVRYITSRSWADSDGNDRVGAVLVVDELAFSARDVVKVDARPGGYAVTGGHGGIVADLGGAGLPEVTYLPTRKHTATSAVRLGALPQQIEGVTGRIGQVERVTVPVKDQDGRLLDTAMPHVFIETWAPYRHRLAIADPSEELGIAARIDFYLRTYPLAGFVYGGAAPYGQAAGDADAELLLATFSGYPVVKCARGNPGGRAYPAGRYMVSANNLDVSHARILLMACLLKFGALPAAGDPTAPTDAEREATAEVIGRYQDVFNTH